MLNQRIREVRQARGMSQVELAGLLGVTKQSVSNWENDNIQPSIEMLVKLAQTLSVSADYLLGLEGRQTLDVSGLSPQAVGHLQLLIEDIKLKESIAVTEYSLFFSIYGACRFHQRCGGAFFR